MLLSTFPYYKTALFVLFLLCALKCEAQPLIEHFQLQPLSKKGPFPLFLKENISLIISGIGKVSAASAVGYAYALKGNPPFSAWLNVGIGGHPSHALGKAVLANKITDQGNGQSFYPLFCQKTSLCFSPVTTVEEIAYTYPREEVFEMEAAGFYAAASRFTTAECIHSLKIISDNCSHPIKEMSAPTVSSLIKSSIPHVASVSSYLLQTQNLLIQENTLPEEHLFFQQKWHFTFTQRQQWKKYLLQYKALYPQASIAKELSSFSSAKEALLYLKQKISHVSASLY